MAPRSVIVALLALLALLPRTARADDDGRVRAAAEFELGLKLYEQADYGRAAEAFLRADALAPSEDALKNGISAARKASNHLTVARASRRAIERSGISAELKASAREALALAAPHLGRLELSCSPTPCELGLDGEPVQAGQVWVLPGTHLARASRDGAGTEKDLVVTAGATYRVALELGARADSKPKGRSTPKDPPPKDSSPSAKPLSPAVFWVGVAATVAAVAVTSWSGLDTLAAEDDLQSDATTREVDRVRAKVRRTDYLLAGTLVLGAATAATGAFWVDWGGPGARGSALGVALAGRF